MLSAKASEASQVSSNTIHHTEAPDSETARDRNLPPPLLTTTRTCQRKKILLPAQPCNLPPGPFLGNPKIVSAGKGEM